MATTDDAVQGAAITAAAPEVDEAPAVVERNPIFVVAGMRSFRYFWFAQFLSALIGGVLRFAFVWLAIDISTSSNAAGLMGLAIGIPGLFVSLPAGVWSDRMDRRKLVTRVNIAGTVVLLALAALILADLITLPLAMLIAVGLGAVQASTLPAFQAMVPQLVPSERLMTGVALQNMGAMVSITIGAVLSGGSIALFGFGVAALIWAGLLALSVLFMVPVRFRDDAQAPAARAAGGAVLSMVRDIAGVLRYAYGREPLRSLATTTLVMGVGIGAYTITLPQIARDDLGQGPFGTSLLFAFMSIGMVSTTLFLASRAQVRRKGVMFLIAFHLFGPGLLVIGLSDHYFVTAGFMVIWGVGGGMLMTSQRTLLQQHTPPELMGRMMALVALSMTGMIIFSALLLLGLGAWLDPGESLAAIGAFMLLYAMYTATRRELREA